MLSRLHGKWKDKTPQRSHECFSVCNGTLVRKLKAESSTSNKPPDTAGDLQQTELASC